MSKSTFQVGDRVSAPGDRVGTVQYVGPVGGKGPWVGVVFDGKPVTNGTDGKAKDGAYYFRCKPGQGMYQKPSYFTKIEDKGSAGKAAKPAEKAPAKKAPEKSDPKAAASKTSAKPAPGKSDGKASKKEADDDAVEIPHKRAAIPDLAAMMNIVETGTQTEIPQETISNKKLAQYIVFIEREKAAKFENENRKLQNELFEANKNLQQSNSKIKDLEHEIKMRDVRLKTSDEKLGEMQLEIEDLKIQLQFAQLDAEESKEKLEDGIDAYLLGLESLNEQEKARVLIANNELKKTLEKVQQTMQDIVSAKNREVAYLKQELAYLPTLTQRVHELVPLEKEVEQLKRTISQMEDSRMALEEAERIIETLKAKNIEMDGELQDWRDYIIDIDDERSILEKLNDENDKIIEELTQTNKELVTKVKTLSDQVKKKEADMSDMQKQVFNLRNEVAEINRAQEEDNDIGSLLAPPEDKNRDNRGNSEKLSQHIVSLGKQLTDARTIITSKVKEAVAGRDNWVRYNMLRAYFPDTVSSQIDDNGMAALSHLERCLHKARQTRALLDRFYADPVSSSSKNSDLCLQSHYLCPSLIKQENFMRAIQKQFLLVKEDDWIAVVGSYRNKFMGTATAPEGNIEQAFDELLDAMEQNKLAEFSDEHLVANEEKLKDYVGKNAPEFDPNKKKNEEERADKATVLQMVSETYYRIQSLTIELNNFSSKLHKVIREPAQGQAANPSEATDHVEEVIDESKNESLSIPVKSTEVPRALSRVGSRRPSIVAKDENSIDNVIAKLQMELIEKIFRVRLSITRDCKTILNKTNPVDLGYKPKKLVSLDQLLNANRTSVKIGQLLECRAHARQALLRAQGLVAAMDKVTRQMSPSERVEKINSFLSLESEAFPEGLATHLDKTYDSVRGVLTLMDTVSLASCTNTDELPSLTQEEQEKALLPCWELKPKIVRTAIDEAYAMKEEMKNKERELTGERQRVFDLQKAAEEKNSSIIVLKQQIEKEKQNANGLTELQTRYNELDDRLKKYVATIQQKTADNEKLRTDNEQLTKQIHNLHQMFNNKEPVIGSVPVVSQPVSQPQPGPGPAEPSLEDFPYIQMLQQTIHALRRRLNIVSVEREMVNIDLDLKPLPKHLTAREIGLRKEAAKIDAEIDKKIAEIKKQKEENVAIASSPSIMEESKDDVIDRGVTEAEMDLLHPTDLSGVDNNTQNFESDKNELNLDQVMEDTNDTPDQQTAANALALQRQQQLNALTTKIAVLRSKPHVVDITSSSKKETQAHEIMGKRIELRQLQLSCEQIHKEIEQEKENKNKKEHEKANKSLGPAFGEVRLPKNGYSLSLPSKMSVVVPTFEFTRLQNAFGV